MLRQKWGVLLWKLCAVEFRVLVANLMPPTDLPKFLMPHTQVDPSSWPGATECMLQTKRVELEWMKKDLELVCTAHYGQG